MQDSSLVAQRKLDCFLYGVYMENSELDNMYEQYHYLAKLGFKTPSLKICTSCKYYRSSNGFINYWDQRISLPFEIDGVVVELIRLDCNRLLEILQNLLDGQLLIVPSNAGKYIIGRYSFSIGTNGCNNPVAICQ